MLRQFVIALSVGSVLSGFAVSVPAIAASGVEGCPKKAGMVVTRRDANGICYYKKASVDLNSAISFQTPRSDRPGRLPNPGGQLTRIVDTAQERGEDVGLPRSDGRVDCIPTPAPQPEDKQAFDNSQGRYCRRVIKTECPKGTIITSPHPLHISQIPAPSVPEGKQDPSEIYPGLPPSPTVPAGNLISSDFTPPTGSGVYQGGNGSPNQGSGAARAHQASLLFDLVNRV